MLYNLKEIKLIRKKYNLTQSDLAKLAGVSQSLIAKVESDLLDPTFSKAQKIFSALDSLTEKKEHKAEHILHKSLIYCTPDSNIKDVIKKMRKHGISQLPVLNEKQPVGYISESIILDALLDKNAESIRVQDIMEDAPPVVAKDCSLQIINNLLHYYPLVIVAQKGKVLGIITKADLLKIYG